MDKAKKKTIKRIISWMALAALVAVLAVMPLLARQEEAADGPVASILEATVQTGQISTSLRGGGILEAGKAMEVKLPSGVKIKEFLVKNGETVTEGTPVATVDRVSVMNAILGVEDTLEYIQEQILSAKEDTVSGTVRATAGGRVKQVFAQKGDSVQDVMLTHGALAVLSLDGRMAVSLEQDTALAAGDTVVVAFPDGREVDGRVESNLNGTLIVTVEDKKYEVGEAVTVTTKDGDQIGKGELYVHNAWRATAFSGTVNTVYAKENTEVSDGATLLTLKDTDFEGTMQSFANLHREYEELLQELFVMYDTEVLTAPCDGLVSGVDEDSPFLLAAIEGEEGWFVDFLNNETSNGAEKGWKVLKLSNGDTCTGDDTCTVKGNHSDPDCPKNVCNRKENCPANEDKHTDCLSQCISGTKEGQCTNSVHKTTCVSNCNSSSVIGGCPNNVTGGVHKKNCIDGCISSDGTTKCDSQIHKSTCIDSCISSDGTKNCPATAVHKEDCIGCCDKTEKCTAKKYHYSNCLTFCTGGEDCTAENHKDSCYMANLVYYAYASLVEQVGSQELIVRQDTGTRYQLATGSYGWRLISPSSLKTDTLTEPGKIPVSNPGQYKMGDVIMQWIGYKGKDAVKSGTFVYKNLAPASPGGSGLDISGLLGNLDLSALMGGLNFGNFGSYGAFAGSGQAQQVQLFDLNGSVLMTVTEQDAMTLTIAIDEHDIAKVSLGQTADVKVTALKGETFEAEVTEIGNYGINNGGSSKFSVELTMAADERMLAGMNAAANIPMFTKMEVLTIPVEALVETETGTVVYTALDQETGEPTAPVAVETGVSDGENVEILSGLNPGDKIYYSFYNVLELDHTAKNEFSFR